MFSKNIHTVNNRKLKRSFGFTLVEIIVAVSLFTLVATISIGAVLSIFDANKKSQTSKTVVDNLNLSIEDMARTVRFGTNYHCGSGGTLTSPQNCSVGDNFLAVNFNSSTVVFRLNNSRIERSTNGGTTYSPITASDVVIETLNFYVFGATDSPSLQQPYVLVLIRGYVGTKPTQQTKFTIETIMSQRALDI